MTIIYKAAAMWINNSDDDNIHVMYNEQMNDFWCVLNVYSQ